MKAKLLAMTDARSRVEETFGARATIGRSDGNTVVLDQSAVSASHAAISWDSETGAYFLEDLESLNGTELDGVSVKGRERLGKLHAINIGGVVDLIYVALDLSGEADGDTASAPAADGTTSFDREIPTLPTSLLAEAGETEGTRVEKMAVPLPEALGGATPAAAARSQSPPEESAQSSAFVLDFGELGGEIPLKQGENLVGRLKTADISLASPDLSRRHATVTVEGDRVAVRDEGSRNHTFLDGEQVQTERDVQAGSVLHFGRLAARLSRVATKADESEEARESDGKEED